MADTMTVQILADGTMKVTTDKVSMANHLTAEKFLKFAAELLGGKTIRKRKRGMVGHVHSHGGHVHKH